MIPEQPKGPWDLSDKWYTPTQIMKQLLICKSTLKRWRHREENPFIFVEDGRFLRCNAADFAWFMWNMRGPKSKKKKDKEQ